MSDGEAVELAATASTPTEEETFPRYRWVIIAQLWAQAPLEYLFASTLGILLPAIRRDIPMTSPEVGWLGSANAFGRLIMFPISPLLVRFPPKRTLAVFVVGAGSMLLTISQAGSFPVFFGVLFIYTACVGLSQVPTQLIRFQWIPQREMATVLGMGLGLSAMTNSLSYNVFPQLLAIPLHWRQIPQGLGILVLVATGLWVVTGREHDTPRYRRGMAGSTGMGALRGALKRREFVLMGLAMMGGSIAYLTTLLFLPTYLVDEGGQSLATAGMVTSFIPLGSMAAHFSAGFTSDRIGRRRPLIWPAGLVLPFLYLAILSLDQPQVLAGLAFALGYAASAPFPVMQTIPFELPDITPSEVAVGQSFMQTIAAAGQTVGPIITGYVTAAMGSLRSGILALALFPILLLIIGLILPETGPAARRKHH